MKNIPCPVITFHSIRPPEQPWKWGHLSCPPDLFEDYLKYLKSRDYTSVLLPDVVEYNQGKKRLPERSIALTFDDGYLDNWTIVVPMLKRYGFFGTIFVNPSFVDPREVVRRQVEGSVQPTREQVDGFMSWQELKLAQDMGVLDVQSHGMTHTWYPVSDEIVGFHHPGDNYPWLAWNARPERKYLWVAEDQSEFVDYGVPVYKHEKSLVARRWFPPEEVGERLSVFVKANGGADFFARTDWKEILLSEVSSMDAKGRYETEDEHSERVLAELIDSRQELSSRLGKSVSIMCWPGGGYDPVAVQCARDAGYLGWDEREGYKAQGVPNIPGKAVEGIGRFSVPVFGSRAASRLAFVYKLESSRGTAGWRQAQLLARRLKVASVVLRK